VGLRRWYSPSEPTQLLVSLDSAVLAGQLVKLADHADQDQRLLRAAIGEP